MGIVCVYLAEILLKLTLGPISTRAMNELLQERSPFPRAGYKYYKGLGTKEKERNEET